MGEIVTAPRAAGSLDRRVEIQRATLADNGLEEVPSWAELTTVWANFWPVSDGEKWRAGVVEGREIARFTIRYSDDAADVTGADRLVFEGRAWGITGVKEIGRKRWLEITAEVADEAVDEG